MPTSPEAVKAWLRLADTADDTLLADVCAAVNAWVGRIPWVTAAAVPTDPDVPDSPPLWPAMADQGATMLAARMYRRRNTPGGVEAFTDAVVYVPRRDGDVDQLLRTGTYLSPRVG